MSLTLLPIELVRLVASFLPLPDSIHLSLSCKKYLALLNQDQVWLTRFYSDFTHIPRTAPLVFSPKEQYHLAQLLEPLRRKRAGLRIELNKVEQLTALPQITVADISQHFPGYIVILTFGFIRSSERLILTPNQWIKGEVFIVVWFVLDTPVEVKIRYYEQGFLRTPYSTLSENEVFVASKLTPVDISCSLGQYLAYLYQEGYWPINSDETVPDIPDCFKITPDE